MNGRATLERYSEARRQVSLADRLLISKTDVAEADRVTELTRAVRELNPTASVSADMAPDAVAVATGIGPTEASRRCAVASRAATDLAALAALVAEGRVGRRALEMVHRHTRDTTPETTAAIGAQCMLWQTSPAATDRLTPSSTTALPSRA